jgi:hypothetical protein
MNLTYLCNEKFAYSSNRAQYENLSLDSLPNIYTIINALFTAMHESPSYDVSNGIEVKPE